MLAYLMLVIAAFGSHTASAEDLSPLAGLSLSRMALLADGDVSQRFLQEIVFPVSEQSPAVAVIYGNRQYGYFETRRFKRTPKQVAGVECFAQRSRSTQRIDPSANSASFA